jgi:hypothetical protein
VHQRLTPTPKAFACFIAIAWVVIACSTAAHATDEIQVYNSEINDPDQWSLQLHFNYAVQGRTQPEIPGGIVPDKSLQGTPELALGITDWFELGAYAPYAVTRDGEALSGGWKLRTLFVAPHAKERTWIYGVNFELSDSPPQFAEERWNLETRPIIGYRSGAYEFIVNPIFDFALSGPDQRGDFAPAARFAVSAYDLWQFGVEHYSDVGFLDSMYAPDQQAQTTFAVIDYNGQPYQVEFGVGHGWTSASDQTIVKMILGMGL